MLYAHPISVSHSGYRTMCMMRSLSIEEIIDSIETEEDVNAEYLYEDDAENQDPVDPDYVAYLGSIYEELLQMVDQAGGELDMTVYSRYLYDELYLGRHSAPYFFNLGLEVVYEE